jgi:hypothetical protein
MDISKITGLHAELLQGIEIEELSNKGLLKYGSLLLKQFKQSKAVLRKIKPEEIAKTQHWIMVREHANMEIDKVLLELESRMQVDLEDFVDGMILAFVDLVGSIRVSIFDEEQLDNQSEAIPETEEVELIFD